MKKMNILLTGATGYIGSRLRPRLLEDTAVQLRLFVRNAQKIHDSVHNRSEVFEGSTFDTPSLEHALKGIDQAYYLIHSMAKGKDYQELDRISAKNFRRICIQAGVKRIIYLGGLGDRQTASKHLLSRIETGEILSAEPDRIQTLWFRAGIIIGSGSASFEIIRHLIKKLPVMTPPKWVRTRTQPISVADVLKYLIQAKDIQVRGNLIVDIGSEVMSFKDMLKRAARVMGLRRLLIPVPLLSPKLSSYWLKLITPVPYGIARELVEGLKSETVVQNRNARMYFPNIIPLSYEESIRDAIQEIEQRQVL